MESRVSPDATMYSSIVSAAAPPSTVGAGVPSAEAVSETTTLGSPERGGWGVAGLFIETRPRTAEAWSDGPNAVPLKHMRALLETLVALDDITKKNGFLENNFGV